MRCKCCNKPLPNTLGCYISGRCRLCDALYGLYNQVWADCWFKEPDADEKLNAALKEVMSVRCGKQVFSPYSL